MVLNKAIRGGAAMGDIKSWFDIVFKTIIAAAVAYGSWYLGFQKQDSEERHTRDQQQNDDIRFIVDMVTSPDTARRTMGVAIVTAYADSKPERVPRQLADAITAYTLVNNNLSDEKRDTEIIRQVQRANPLGTPTATATSASSRSTPLRIYIQFQRGEDRDAVELIRQKLNGSSADGMVVIAPPIENVRTTVANPVLKCFRTAECEQFGKLLVERLKASGAPPSLTLQPIAGFENSTAIRPNHFEAWFGPL